MPRPRPALRASLACCSLLLTVASAPAAQFIWIEAERFADRGAWTCDAQFLDLMGSPYLMAIGLGKPVSDAKTTINPPRPGRYRLWARTKDWVPEHHPGRFQVVLAGKTLPHVFGQSGRAGWQWEDAGLHDLSGPVELRLHDLTGYYARCDALVFCDDPNWTPPLSKDEIAALRVQHGGVSREIQDVGPYDVVVVGGGLAGCVSAVSAARLGVKTALIQNRPVLGGNASTEILVPPVGLWPGKIDRLDPRETGLLEEFRTEGRQKVREGALYSKRLARFVSDEPNLDLYLNTHATGVQMRPVPLTPGASPANGRDDGRTIAAIQALNVDSGQRLRFRTAVVIDCSGDSVVALAAGAEYRQGKEPKNMYNEPYAPDEASPNTMGNGLKYFHHATGQAQPFDTPPWAYAFATCENFAPGRHPKLVTGIEIGHQWQIELGGLQDTFADAEEIRDDLLRLIYGLWDHVKNNCEKYSHKVEDHKLAWVGHVAGKRENRRLIGDYVLTQNDVGVQTLFPDRVAYGGWIIDDHHSGGFFHKGSFGMHYDDPAHAYGAVQFSIPLRSLYSKSVANLLMAGRNISASHMAMSDTRVMLTCALMGQATGTAAALCVKHSTTPRGVGEQHLAQLQQQLLKDGAHVIDLPNADPGDLARRAQATASSQRTRADGEVMSAAAVIDGFARAAHGKSHAWAPDPQQPLPQWLELRWDQPQAFNLVHVIFQAKDYAPRRFALQIGQGQQWQTVVEVQDNAQRRLVLPVGAVQTNRLRLLLLEQPKPDFGLCEIRVYKDSSAVVETARRVARKLALPDEPPDLPWGNVPESFSGLDPTRLPGIVLDDPAAQRNGAWQHSNSAEPYVGNGYLHDGNADKSTKLLEFSIPIAKAGRYEVRLAYNAQANRADRVPITIRTPQGEQTMHVDQRQAPAQPPFHSLGVFAFPAGTAHIVIGNEGTQGFVVVDAIQLIPQD